jgi:hypothetical protein
MVQVPKPAHKRTMASCLSSSGCQPWIVQLCCLHLRIDSCRASSLFKRRRGQTCLWQTRARACVLPLQFLQSALYKADFCVAAYAKDLLQHLFQLIEKDVAPEKVQENEFLMRCVMRVLIVIKDGVIPVTDIVCHHLVEITKVGNRSLGNQLCHLLMRSTHDKS